MDNIIENNASVDYVETAAQKSERVFKQSELNEIVGRAKHEAVESFKRQYASQQPTQSSYEQSRLSESDIARIASEELARQRQAWLDESSKKVEAEHAQRIVENYKKKIAVGKEKYDDFEQVTNINMGNYTNVVHLLAETVDNADEVLYELAQNRTKLRQINDLAKDSYEDAVYEMQKLSKSIKTNNEASAKYKQSKEPLSQLKPSNSGKDSADGVPSVAYFKQLYGAKKK